VIKLDVPDAKDDPERGPGYTVQEVWAYVAVDPETGSEGVIAVGGTVLGERTLLPLVFTDRKRAFSPAMREHAIRAGRMDRKEVRFLHFTNREKVETVYVPPGA
jgi:hypothetical protein